MDFGFIKWIIERWRKLDKQTRRLMRFALGFIITVFVYGFIAFLIDKYYSDKPAQYLWLHNYVKPDTVVITVEKPVYIRDTTPDVGRDKYDIKGNPNISTR